MHHQVEDFLLDTGDALEMVTPSLKTTLGPVAPTTGILQVLNHILYTLPPSFCLPFPPSLALHDFYLRLFCMYVSLLVRQCNG